MKPISFILVWLAAMLAAIGRPRECAVNIQDRCCHHDARTHRLLDADSGRARRRSMRPEAIAQNTEPAGRGKTERRGSKKLKRSDDATIVLKRQDHQGCRSHKHRKRAVRMGKKM